MADVQMKVHDVPGPLCRKINHAAKQGKTSANEIVVQVLAGRFNHQHQARNGAFTGGMDSPMLNLRLPAELHRAVKTHAASTGVPMRSVIIGELAQHFGVKAEPAGRRRRS